MLPGEIISTVDVLKELEKRYPGLQDYAGTIKPMFSKTQRIFFQCGKTEDNNACLKRLLSRQDFEEFIIISVVKETGDGGKSTYSIDESRFKRMGRETIEGFINRYQKNLTEPVRLACNFSTGSKWKS